MIQWTLSVRGGAGGIRTLDTVLPYTHFPGERLRPLGHRSAFSRNGGEVASGTAIGKLRDCHSSSGPPSCSDDPSAARPARRRSGAFRSDRERLASHPRRPDHGDDARRSASSRHSARAALCAPACGERNGAGTGALVGRDQRLPRAENWVAQWGDASEQKPLPPASRRDRRRSSRSPASRSLSDWAGRMHIRPRPGLPQMAGRSRPTGPRPG